MMDNTEDFEISAWEQTRSQVNSFLLTARNRIALARGGYWEASTIAAVKLWQRTLSMQNRALTEALIEEFHAQDFLPFTSLENFQKNLATLWILEEFFSDSTNPNLAQLKLQPQLAYDIGCQDFARAPALQRFFSSANPNCVWVGIELDAYPPLRSLYSRFDMARHFCRHVPNARFVAADIFLWKDCAQLVTTFFPFVSPHPALAWGLPKKFGNAHQWLASCSRVVAPGGYLFVAHQGEWEEKEWDEARLLQKAPLQLLQRSVHQCPFLPHPYPLHISLYKRT